MASCSTPQFGSSTCPQFVLIVTASGGAVSNNTCTVSWSLVFQAHGYAWNSSKAKNYSVTIDGVVRKTGSFVMNGITGSSTVASGSFTANRGTGGAARTISFSVTVDFGSAAWSGTAGGTKSASGSVATPAITQTWTVSYNANGGTGAPTSQTKSYGKTLTLSTTKPTRSGYLFLGWGTSASSTSVAYASGGSYTANASATLYAIWQVAELIKIEGFPSNLTLNNNSSGIASIPSLNVPFNPISTQNNYNTPFYYKICYVDNDNGDVANLSTNGGTTHGPFTADDIGDGAGSDDAFSLPIPSAILLKSLQNCRNNKYAIICVAVSTTNNSFSKDLTTYNLVKIPLVNFYYLDSKILSAYRSGTNIIIKTSESIAKSYGTAETSRTLTEKTQGTVTYTKSLSAKTLTDHKEVNAIITIPSANLSKAGFNNALDFTLKITDGILNDTHTIRIPATGNDKIYIYKSTKKCEASEFIEADVTGFQRGGRVYSKEFVESSNTAMIGQNMQFGEIIEK